MDTLLKIVAFVFGITCMVYAITLLGVFWWVGFKLIQEAM